MPIDYTGQFLAEARRYAIAQGIPSHAKLRVCIKLADSGEEVARLLALPGMPPAAVPVASGDPGDFDPTPLQARIIVFLAEGPKSAKQLREKIGTHLYDSAGALNDLIEVGIVEKRFAKFKLTDDVGQALAAEIGDEEPEEE